MRIRKRTQRQTRRFLLWYINWRRLVRFALQGHAEKVLAWFHPERATKDN